MRVLIISADNIYLTPYIHKYISILNNSCNEYSIIYWDKNNNETIDKENYIRFSTNSNSKISKVIGYLRFKKLIECKIKELNIDFIIPLHQIVCLLISNILIGKFYNNFIYDVRDYSYEKYSLVRKIEKKLVKASTINIISSEGFKKFLPKGEYYINHNLPYLSCDEYKQLKNSNNGKVVISYIGLIRFMNQNKKIINFFKNDPRFQLNFIGTNAEQLESYCHENNVCNVTLMSTFSPKKTLEFYKNTDLIMNLYGSNTPLLDYAISNKLYYSALLYKPILVCEGTFMEKISIENGFGYVLKMKEEDEKTDLYNFIINLDRKKLVSSCDLFIETVKKDEEILNEKLEEILK